MKKVLLIGANSYIGNAFESYIYNRMEVDKVRASNRQWENVDLSRYDTIVMLAAIVHLKEQKHMEELYREVNCELPVRIAKKAKASGVRHFIFLSTAAVYGSKATRITYTTEELPDTLYGLTKLEAEKRLMQLSEPNQFQIGIVRPPMVYGEECKGNYQKLIKLSKYTMLFPKINNKRSMIYIDVLCEYLEKMIINETTGIKLPQDDQYKETALLVKQIRKEMGKKTILFPGIAWLIRILVKRNKLFGKLFGDFYYEAE